MEKNIAICDFQKKIKLTDAVTQDLLDRFQYLMGIYSLIEDSKKEEVFKLLNIEFMKYSGLLFMLDKNSNVHYVYGKDSISDYISFFEDYLNKR